MIDPAMADASGTHGNEPDGGAEPEDLETIDRAIAAFDGRHVAPLQTALTRLKPSDAVLRALVVKCSGDGEAVRTAASWMLKGMLERGAALPPGVIDRLVSDMPRIDGWEARLHIAQAFQWVAPDAPGAMTAAATLERWYESDKAFLRAWACDALWRLGQQHEALMPLARRVVARAERDPAASVRARARNLARGR